MKNSVVIAIVVVAAVLGGAALLYERLFAEPTSVAVTETPDANRGQDRGPAPTPSDAGLSDAGAADAGPVDPNANRARVLAVRGLVQTQGEDKKWREIKQGDFLDAAESVRTGRTGEAKLAVGEGIEVRLSPKSEFSIREINEGVSRVRLEEGQVSASVDENGQQVLKVEAKGSDAVAEATGGSFGMVTDGRGQVAVATTTGSVKLTSQGESVDVAAGTQSAITKGKAPSAPVEIPKSLFLKVVNPIRKTTNVTTTTVRGTTAPGALVEVGGRTTTADGKGRFRARVKLKDGVNQLNVAVIDAQGNRKNQQLPDVVVDREAPEIDATMKWGQDK